MRFVLWQERKCRLVLLKGYFIEEKRKELSLSNKIKMTDLLKVSGFFFFFLITQHNLLYFRILRRICNKTIKNLLVASSLHLHSYYHQVQ
jgi:hypothetical protein